MPSASAITAICTRGAKEATASRQSSAHSRSSHRRTPGNGSIPVAMIGWR
ncbi:MAG: hypothetical protein AVDCRST_MAG73-3822 [uncultured Thermomicrobiales bacterium]|uniref:Uncharacterized protein n=1 Tax=uncultured Thermomicrobiales bacterium TaxID=1645740 RepID=A0A6J4UWZ1_9BACT|nr:MAG: hypothetical protein AVDCRST_MAG73-3822 [uncultured Thermomicrobiales bacterium]